MREKICTYSHDSIDSQLNRLVFFFFFCSYLEAVYELMTERWAAIDSEEHFLIYT